MPLNPSISKVVPGGGETIQTYQYTDIAAGTGMVEYYLGETNNSGTPASHANLYMSDHKFYSTHVLTGAKSFSGAYTRLIERTADIEFNLPRVMKGNALVNVPLGMYVNVAPGCNSYVYAYVKKVSDAGVTDIAHSSGAIVTAGVALATYTRVNSAISIPIPQTHFKRGDSLRLLLEVWSSTTGNSDVFIGHDPQNRAATEEEWGTKTFGTQPSILTFTVPFKIDLP